MLSPFSPSCSSAFAFSFISSDHLTPFFIVGSDLCFLSSSGMSIFMPTIFFICKCCFCSKYASKTFNRRLSHTHVDIFMTFHSFSIYPTRCCLHFSVTMSFNGTKQFLVRCCNSKFAIYYSLIHICALILCATSVSLSFHWSLVLVAVSNRTIDSMEMATESKRKNYSSSLSLTED